MIYDTITLTAEAETTDGADLTVASGDSLTIQNFVTGTQCFLIGVTASVDKACTLQLTAPSFSDTSRGLRFRAGTNYDGWISHHPVMQNLQETELLTAKLYGAASDNTITGVFILHVFYENLPGRAGYYMDRQAMMQAAVRSITVEGQLAAQTGLAWGPRVGIAATNDYLRSQRPYAIVGGSIQADGGGLGVVAPDWANTRQVIPSRNSFDPWTVNWFEDLAMDLGRPAIPIFNSGNKPSIYIEACPRAKASTVDYAIHLVELSGDPDQYSATR